MTGASAHAQADWSVRASIRSAAARLAAAGVGSPRYDAESLAAHVLGSTRVGLLSMDRLGPAAVAQFAHSYDALIDRRVAREPLQHITGVAYFRHLALAVGPGVFVPRPETELLVDLVSPALTPRSVVADLCAGSGAIGLAIASEHPGTRVHLVEADPDAARWLHQNVAALDPATTAPEVHELALEDWFPLTEGVDLVVSNPPYLPTGAGDRLSPEVADYDPPRALWGGPDGLAVVRDVVDAAARVLRSGGLLAVEHDARHQAEVVALLHAGGFVGVQAHLDLTTQPRFVTGSLQ